MLAAAYDTKMPVEYAELLVFNEDRISRNWHISGGLLQRYYACSATPRVGYSVTDMYVEAACSALRNMAKIF
jgi:hypothetical protein